jgi:hypothetical protein
MCIKTVSSPSGLRLTANSTTELFHPIGPWMPAIDTTWQFNLMIRGLIGSFQARPGYQVAVVRPDNPADPTGLGTATITEGWTRFAPTAPDFSGQFFWRPGIMASCVSGSFGQADVQLDVQLNTKGELLGTHKIEVQPLNDSNTTIPIHPITGWFPALGLTYVRAAMVFMNNTETDTMLTRLYFRGANDLGAPAEAWTALEAADPTPAGNSERNTTKLAIGAGGNYVQLGLGTYKTSGNPSRCTIHIASISTRS